MKKLFIYGTMALMALTSCNDFLDKAPLDAFTNTPAYWSNTSNLDNQCNTFYNNYSGYGNGSGSGWYYFKTLLQIGPTLSPKSVVLIILSKD